MLFFLVGVITLGGLSYLFRWLIRWFILGIFFILVVITVISALIARELDHRRKRTYV